MASGFDERFYCGLCTGEESLLSATPLDNCSCLFCANCLSLYVEQQLENLTGLLTRSAFLQQYCPLRAGIYIDDDGATHPAKVVSARFGETWEDSELSLELSDGQSCETQYWRFRLADDRSYEGAVSGFSCLACPGEGCHGLITKTEAAELCPVDFERFLEREAVITALKSGSVQCPECQFLIQCVNDEDPREPLHWEAHGEHYRFRCRSCQKDFCGVCLTTPYHKGFNCRQFHLPDCRYCQSKLDPTLASPLEAAPGETLSVRQLKQLVKDVGVDDGWCCEKRDFVWVSDQIKRVCHAAECRNLLKHACTKQLPCGHGCSGVRGAVVGTSQRHTCLPCFEPDCPHAVTDADNCQICWESFRTGPCMQFPCLHYIHLECARARLVQGYPGPAITFNHLCCALCGMDGGGNGAVQIATSNCPMNHPRLKKEVTPILKLREATVALAMTHLKASEDVNAEELKPGGVFHGRPADYALKIYKFYLCYQCKKPYFGGRRDCEAAEDAAEYDAKELICGSCCAAAAGQNCPRHGTRFIEWKCRYCCQVASWFCFGTTHFCDPCHRSLTRRNVPCRGANCPLKINHPQPGTEFCLGCAICRHRYD